MRNYVTNLDTIIIRHGKNPEEIHCRIGIDIAKNVFQVHGIDFKNGELITKTLKRDQVFEFFANMDTALIGIEACGTSQYWARELTKLGHVVRLLHPKAVKAFLQGSKSDANDAYAIFCAVQSPDIREVSVKDIELQSLDSLRVLRAGVVKEQTAAINRFRMMLAEYGQVMPKSVKAFFREASKTLVALEGVINGVTYHALVEELQCIRDREEKIKTYDRRIHEVVENNQLAKLLKTMPGVGDLIACAMAVALADPGVFKSGRDFAAFLGLVPGHTGSGGKIIMLGITKRGDRSLRSLLINGAMSVLRQKHKPDFVERLLKKAKPKKVIAVAVAARMARALWAMASRKEAYKAKVLSISNP